MYQITRAPSFQIPGLDQFTPVKTDYSGIERGLSALGKGLVTSLEERKLKEALDKANNPEVEKLQRAQQATQEELERARAETDSVLQQEATQAIYGSANPAQRTPEQDQEVKDWLDFANNQTPEQQARGLERPQWVDPNAQTQQDYYRVGNQEFRDAPDPQTLGIITAREKAKAWEAEDPRIAMLYEADAQRQLAQHMEQQYLQLEQTRDVPGAVRLHSDIPDGITSIEKKLPDGTWEVYTHPDGKPDAAKLFARGTEDDVFSTIRRTLDPKAWDAAAKLKYERDRQAATDQRYAQQESRYADTARRQELVAQLNYLQKMQGAATTQEDFVRFGMMQEQVSAQLMGMGQGGLGGPVQGGAEPRAIFDYLTQQRGVSPTHAVGILANIEQESGFNPAAVHDNNTGYGLFGHRLDRRDRLFASAGTSAPNWQQQVDYLLTEPETQQYLSADYGNDIGAAAGQFTRLVERPKDMETRAKERAALAQNYAPYLSGPSPQQGLGGPVVSPGHAADGMGPPAPSIGALGTNFNNAWAAGQKPAKAQEPFVYTYDQSQSVLQEAEMMAIARYTPEVWAKLPPADKQAAINDIVNANAAQAAPLTGKAFVPFGANPQGGAYDYDGASANILRQRAAQQ